MIRIQRQRTRGWRMPAGAFYVGRPSRWGNPYRVSDYLEWYSAAEAPSLAVSDFRNGAILRRFPDSPAYPTAEEIRAELSDATALACWCPLDEPRHADVLIELLAQ